MKAAEKVDLVVKAAAVPAVVDVWLVILKPASSPGSWDR